MSLWSRMLHPVMRHFRRARAEMVAAQYPDLPRMRVLDLGGSTHFWDAVGDIIRPGELTILNVVLDGTAISRQSVGDRYTVELYDGRRVPYADDHFDLVICNSVIEHVPVEARANLASEIARVGRNHVVQTPAYECPVEPHFVAPFIHWLPRSLGRPLSRVTPRGLMGGGRPVTDVFDETRLLRRKELQALFPASQLHVERVAGMPKSYTLIG